MNECEAERKFLDGEDVVLGGAEIHVKFTRYKGDPGVLLDFTPPSGADGRPEGIEDINGRLAGLSRSTVMNMDEPARLRLLGLVERDEGEDRMLYRLRVVMRATEDGSHETRVLDDIDPEFMKIDAGVEGRALACRQQIELLLGPVREENRERRSEEMFEILETTNYPPAIRDQTEEEARKGMLEGEELMILEIQVIGFIEKFKGKDNLSIEYTAACSPKALTSPMMKEILRLLSKVCEDTVLVLSHPVAHRLFLAIQEQAARELCLYRISVWCSMKEDGSPLYSIRDQIDPVFENEDPKVGKRAEEARRLAGKVVDESSTKGPDR
jgi:hypothetical protein